MNLNANLRKVTERIARAAERTDRRVEEIKLIAVSKTQPAELLREAYEAGYRTFGENKVTEAEDKVSQLGLTAEWHLIGHLQSNKARKAVRIFDVIQTLDSVELAARLERVCVEEGRQSLEVFVQVDLAGEETKSGIPETLLDALVEFLSRCERLKFTGLMILPPFSEDLEEIRPYFIRLREIRDRLAKDGAFHIGSGELSMGMSHDFEIAIEEGATIVRVGTSIFGSRQTQL